MPETLMIMGIGGSATVASAPAVLLESGSYLLLESGSKLLME